MDALPLYMLPRCQVVFPKMASEDFLRKKAPEFITHSRRRVEQEAAGMRPHARPLGNLEGFVFATRVAMKLLAVFEQSTGTLAGGVAQGIVWVDDAFRGRSIGQHALAEAFATGVKTVSESVFFSPDGYANRASAHRRAVEQAVARGERLPAEVLADYEPGHPRPVHRQFLPDLPSIPFYPQHWPDARDMLRLRAGSGSYADAHQFADATVGSMDRSATRWEIRDSLGCLVDHCSGWKAEQYRRLREYRVQELEPDHHLAGRIERYAACHRRARELWDMWEQADERGCIPSHGLSGVRGRHAAAAHAAHAVAMACGAEMARPRASGMAPAWAALRRAAGFEVIGQACRVWVCVRQDSDRPGVLVVRELACSPESPPDTLQTALAGLSARAGRAGMKLAMPEALAMSGSPNAVVDLDRKPGLSLCQVSPGMP